MKRPSKQKSANCSRETDSVKPTLGVLHRIPSGPKRAIFFLTPRLELLQRDSCNTLFYNVEVYSCNPNGNHLEYFQGTDGEWRTLTYTLFTSHFANFQLGTCIVHISRSILWYWKEPTEGWSTNITAGLDAEHRNYTNGHLSRYRSSRRASCRIW